MNNKKIIHRGALGKKNSVKTMNNHVAAYNPTGGKKYREQEEKGVAR
jgi:hypothetical protein